MPKLKRHRGFITNSWNASHLSAAKNEPVRKKFVVCLSFDQVPCEESQHIFTCLAVLFDVALPKRTPALRISRERAHLACIKAKAQINSIDKLGCQVSEPTQRVG